MITNSTKRKRTLYYWLNVIFFLFALVPVAGFVYLGIKYEFLHDRFIKPFLLGVLVYALVGFTLLRKIFDKVINISREFSRKVKTDISGVDLDSNEDEISNIVVSFQTIEEHYRDATQQLETKARLLTLLKELAELCYITRNADEILHLTLERSLKMVNADVGSVLIFNDDEPKSFMMKASIGHGDRVKIGDDIDFESSIAKYAIINRAPLVVEDIEKETRLGRSNRKYYGTKSFICMPLKGIREPVGVLSVSCKREERTFTTADAEVLTPLLAIATFTYENIRYNQESSQFFMRHKSVEQIFKTLNSSFKGVELLHGPNAERYPQRTARGNQGDHGDDRRRYGESVVLQLSHLHGADDQHDSKSYGKHAQSEDDNDADNH